MRFRVLLDPFALKHISLGTLLEDLADGRDEVQWQRRLEPFDGPLQDVDAEPWGTLVARWLRP